MGRQALAFLPNEIWIHAGDTIAWTWRSDELHTSTFLTAGQVTPTDPVAGCGTSFASGAAFDGSTCLSTPPMAKGQTFAVSFPAPGNYKIECLIHNTMTGTVHVLAAGMILPHDQAYYDRQGEDQARKLLANARRGRGMDGSDAMDDMGAGADAGSMWVRLLPRRRHDASAHDASSAGEISGGDNRVIAGIGEISSTPGGMQTSSLLRFVHGTITVHAGDTVEWSNFDPEEGHTITFGPDPANPFLPSANVTVDPDGALHAVIGSPSESVSSGAIFQAGEDEPGLPSNPLAANPTRFRATFVQPGTYNYHCIFHGDLGMVGKVIVLP